MRLSDYNEAPECVLELRLAKTARKSLDFHLGTFRAVFVRRKILKQQAATLKTSKAEPAGPPLEVQRWCSPPRRTVFAATKIERPQVASAPQATASLG